jgi:hypothetical protein
LWYADEGSWSVYNNELMEQTPNAHVDQESRTGIEQSPGDFPI